MQGPGASGLPTSARPGQGRPRRWACGHPCSLGKKGAKESAAGWLAQRRRESARAAAVPTAPEKDQCLAEAQDDAAWTEKHEAEVQHQKAERERRACAAVEEGAAQSEAALGDSRFSAKVMQNFRNAETKRAADWAAKHRRQEAVRAAPKPMAVRGARVFLEESATRECDMRKWAHLRKSLTLQLETERHLASIIVVLNPAEPGDRNKAIAAMLGLALCAPSHLESGAGPLLQLRRALNAPRYIFVSAACQAKHAAMLNFMKSVARGAANSRWQWFAASADEENVFWSRAARRQRAKNRSEMVTLVVPTERANFARYPRVQTLTEFIKHMSVIDQARSLIGLCQQ